MSPAISRSGKFRRPQSIHIHKLLPVPAGRIGRGDERRIVLGDEPESGVRPTFSGASRATMVT
jgi:hypothetical protein